MLLEYPRLFLSIEFYYIYPTFLNLSDNDHLNNIILNIYDLSLKDKALYILLNFFKKIVNWSMSVLLFKVFQSSIILWSCHYNSCYITYNWDFIVFFCYKMNRQNNHQYRYAWDCQMLRSFSFQPFSFVGVYHWLLKRRSAWYSDVSLWHFLCLPLHSDLNFKTTVIILKFSYIYPLNSKIFKQEGKCFQLRLDALN